MSESYFPVAGIVIGTATDFFMKNDSGGFASAALAFADAKAAGTNVPELYVYPSVELHFTLSLGVWVCNLYRPVFRFDMSGYVGPAESAIVKLTVLSELDWGEQVPSEILNPSTGITGQVLKLVIVDRPSALEDPSTADWARIESADSLASDDVFNVVDIANLDTLEFNLNDDGIAHAEDGGAFALRLASDIADTCPSGLVNGSYLVIPIYEMDDEVWATDWVAPELVITIGVATLPPDEPSTFLASVTPTQVILTWSNVEDEDSFEISRRTYPLDGTPGVWEDLPDQSEDTLTYTDEDIDVGIRYQYRIRACNAGGCSEYTYLVASIPTWVRVTNALSLDWTRKVLTNDLGFHPRSDGFMEIVSTPQPLFGLSLRSDGFYEIIESIHAKDVLRPVLNDDGFIEFLSSEDASDPIWTREL